MYGVELEAGIVRFRLRSLCSEHSVYITNIFFQLRDRHETICLHPSSKNRHLKH